VANRAGGGSDGNAYKEFRNFTSANSFKDGDICYVRSGVYDCTGNSDAINIQANNVILKGYGNETAIIDGSPGTDAVFVANASNVTISGFTIRNSSKKGIVLYGSVNGCIVSKCKVYECRRAGITMIGEAGRSYPKDCIIEHNTCFNNGWGWDGEAGISVQRLGTGCKVRFNSCYNNKQPDPAVLSSWTQDGSANRWYTSYDNTQLGGTVIKLYIDVSGQVGTFCFWPSYEKKSRTGVTSEKTYFIDSVNHRVYVYHVGTPGTAYACRSPSGWRYPDGNGITIDSDSGAVEVYGNVCYGNGGAGINAANPGNNGMLIYNNTCYKNGTQVNSWGTPTTGNIEFFSNRVGINVSPINSNMKIKNNIVFNNFQYNVAFLTFGNSYTPKGIESDHNLYYNAGSANIRFSDSKGGENSYNRLQFKTNTEYGLNDVEEDPKCENSSVGNFYLSKESPARNVGVDLSSVFSVDKDGTPFPQGKAWDLGAYRYIEAKPSSKVSPPTGVKIIDK
jgi:parallel beta-helix repeat protein